MWVCVCTLHLVRIVSLCWTLNRRHLSKIGLFFLFKKKKKSLGSRSFQWTRAGKWGNNLDGEGGDGWVPIYTRWTNRCQPGAHHLCKGTTLRLTNTTKTNIFVKPLNGGARACFMSRKKQQHQHRQHNNNKRKQIKKKTQGRVGRQEHPMLAPVSDVFICLHARYRWWWMKRGAILLDCSQK